MDIYERRRKFHAFLRDFYRDAGCKPPEEDSDVDSATAFDVQVDGVDFSVGYDPAAGESCLFAWCWLGEVPRDEEAAVLRRLLERNVALGRDHGAAFCIDADTRQVVCYLRSTLSVIDAQGFHEELAHLAQLTREWRRNRFGGTAHEDLAMGFSATPPCDLFV